MKLLDNLCLFDDLLFMAVMQEHPEVVDVILSAFFDEIPEIESVEPQYPIANFQGKRSFFDALIRAKKPFVGIIEVQNLPYGFPIDRFWHYASGANWLFVAKGVGYSKVPPIHLIILSRYALFNEKLGEDSIVAFMEKSGNKVKPPVESHFANLQYAKKGTKVYELLRDFAQTDYKNIHNPIIRNAIQDIKYMKRGGQFMGKFQEYLDEAEVKGRAEGKAEGIVEGKAEGQLSTLTDLYHKGIISIDDVAEYMGKNVDEIRPLLLKI